MSDDTFPRRLGPYRPEGLLGRGGMGVVLAAYDERLDRRVALKRVLAKDDDPRRRERLRREARAAAGLDHPAIVQVFDLLEEADGDWIVMELVEGTRLAEALRGGPLEVGRALAYGRQIAEGLAAAHARGIVHRDLKTENVMVLPDGRVKILDFGLAKRLGRAAGAAADTALSLPGQVMGTGRAMSPEQARGLEVGPRSDLFSFGVLVYEMLADVSPFRGESFYDTLARIATHRPASVDELIPAVPGELSELVDRLLERAPELRPASARDVAATLARIEEERLFEDRRASSSGLRAVDGSTVTEVATAVHPAQVSAALRAGGFRGWRRAGFLGAAALAITLVSIFAPRILRDAGPSGAGGGPVPAENFSADPLALYEEGMREVRRIDRPESVDRAIALFECLLDHDDDSAAAHAGLARAYWEKARNVSLGADPMFLEQAEAMAQEAVRLDPFLADARVSLGLARHSRGDSEDARRQLDAALELDPTHADARYGLAEIAEAAGRPELAESHLRRALELHPAPLYHDALGALLYAAARFEEAEASFLRSLELAPDNVHALRNLGGLYYAQGRLDEAAAKFQAALKVRPHASLYSNLGTILFSRGLYAKASEAFESALETAGATHNPIFWMNLADAYRQLPGREEAAQTNYRRAIELLGERIAATPEHPRPRSRRALARARSGNCPAALDDLVRLRELGEIDVYSRFRQAVAEELCGERERALASLENALRSGLDLSEARREPDLLELRADTRYHLLLMRLPER